MKNLTKVLLATLMLVGFSASVFANVNCSGLSKTNGKVVDGWFVKSSHHACKVFNVKWYNKKRDFVDPITGEVRSQVNSTATKRVFKSSQKARKTSMTMDEIRAHKFDPSLDRTRTPEKDLIAKTLIEKFDLWNVYRVGGGAGIRHKLKEIGLEYAGGEITDYSKNIHAGNIFVYMDNNFTAMEVAQKLKISNKDFSEMGVDVADIFSGKVSTRTLKGEYGSMLKKRRDANGVSVETVLTKL